MAHHDESVEITVAAYGPSAAVHFDPNLFSGPTFEDQGHDVPWAERRHVKVRALGGETLAMVIDRAADEFGLRVPFGGPLGFISVSSQIDGVAFYTGGGPDFRRYFAGVDEAGRILWGRPDEITVAELLSAAERGFNIGDPTRIYLWPMVPQGGEIITGFWEIFVELAKVAYSAAVVAANAYGAVAAVNAVLRRFELSSTAFPQAHTALVSRRGGPAQLLELVAARRLSTEELSELLGLDPSVTENLMTALGLDKNSEGRWAISDTVDGQFVWRITDTMLQCALVRGEDEGEFDKTVQGALKQLANAPDRLPSREAFWMQRDPGDGDLSDETFGDDAAGATHSTFRIISASTPIDVEQLEKRLNELGAEGFDIDRVLERRKLSDGSRADVFVLVQHRWE